MIRVAIVDDHPLMREGIKKVLAREDDIRITGEASDGKKALRMLKKDVPDILIQDMTMPGKSGLELIKDIKKLHAALPVLILSIHPAERFAVRTLKAGASGYLCKTSISDDLVKAIHRIVTEKRRYITPDVAEQLVLQVDCNGRAMHESLSDREFEVLCRIAEGKEVQQIADDLSLSPHTVHTYRSRIKNKMNLASNVEMTRYALENKLIS